MAGWFVWKRVRCVLKWSFCLILLLALLLVCWIIREETRFTRLQYHAALDLTQISPGTLVVYGVNRVLCDRMNIYNLNRCAVQVHLLTQKLRKEYPSFKAWPQLFSVLMRDAKASLVEKNVLQVMEAIRARGGKVIALENIPRERLEPCFDIAFWRAEHLQSLGFKGDFDDFTFKLPNFTCRPVFVRGLLAGDGADEGVVLGRFLVELKVPLTKIIAIDDSLEVLCAIQKYCKDYAVPFVGYDYRGCLDSHYDYTGYPSDVWNETYLRTQAEPYLRAYQKRGRTKLAKRRSS